MFPPSGIKKSASVSSNFASCSRRDLGFRYTQRIFRVVLFIAIVDENRSVRGVPSCLSWIWCLGRREGSASSAFSIFTKNVIVIDSDLSIVYLIMQPCFGYGYYVGLVGQCVC